MTVFSIPSPVNAIISASGLATEATLLALSAKIPALGQSTMAGSMPIVIASDQTAIPILNANLDAALSTLATEATLANVETNIGALIDASWTGSGAGSVIAILKAIWDEISGGASGSAANDSVSTSAVGATYVALNTVAAERVSVINDTGVDLELRQGGSGVAIPVFAGSFFTFAGIANANELDVRRVDLSNTQVTVKYRLEA